MQQEINRLNGLLVKNKNEQFGSNYSPTCPILECPKSSSRSSVASFFEDLFVNQYEGLTIGCFTSLIVRYGDQRIASRIAKRYSIKQKQLTETIFPTLICLIQIVLRKRSKNSKIADFLSAFKYTAKTKTTPATNQRSSNVSSNSRPRQKISSNSDLDSVFVDSNCKRKQKKSKKSLKSKSQSSSNSVFENSNKKQNSKTKPNSVTSLPKIQSILFLSKQKKRPQSVL